MLTRTDFIKKQVVFLFTRNGDKLSYSNDNIIIKTSEGKVKYQSSCYRLFLVIVVGNTSITSGLLQRANRFGFTICLMSEGMRVYQIIGSKADGNTLLRKKQYEYDNLDIGKVIICNKITNQKDALIKIRGMTERKRDCINLLSGYKEKLESGAYNRQEIMGVEGAAAKVYFSEVFNQYAWIRRQPRIKHDYINATMDMGYTILFNFVDAILMAFGFDTYCGVMHTCYYMRKSLVCDIMEPMRPIIDLQIRKSINLQQCKVDDFMIYNYKYTLQWKENARYVEFFMGAILDYQEEIFMYIQEYYRAFMKGADSDTIPEFRIIKEAK